ncbi:MAG TPA: hypothetical protein VEH57_08965 [Thermoplasmata archaeon]|nr:hypothetical protein [Thermoplasmata archaeon]
MTTVADSPAHPLGPDAAEESLLDQLHQAIATAPSRPTEIEVGIRLSITLGRQRPAVSCGGCQAPLEFEGIPARTNPRLGPPFRLVYSSPAGP